MRRPAADLTRLDRLLDAALTLSGEERGSFLRALAEREPTVADDLRALVADAERSRVTDRWGAAVDDAQRAIERPAGVLDDLSEGERVGPYRILHLIGHGGMAAVYLADRIDGGFSQRVALKLVPRDLLSAHALGRFEQERQILANLDHRHIARLFDGGVDAHGRSYIAMEYVEGDPIDRYCADRQLSIEQRLALFAQVMDAVQYAHRNLVIHRDLKPSNILVSPGDPNTSAIGTVKLLDFGIAKLLDASAAGPQAAPATRTVYRVLTPGYASPEQLRGSTITTASDVYQLGLLLYELLTGVRATRASRPADAEDAESALDISPLQPARPSTVVDRARSRALKGDLDNIVLKALEPDPARRYESPADLAKDLDRYRRGLPVSARNATRRYRIGKFLRRHTLGVAVGAVMAVVLLVLAAMLIVQTIILRMERDRVRVEAAKAGEIRDFLTSLFDVPLDEANPTLSARDLIDRAAARVANVDPNQPLVRAQMMNTLGGLYVRLGFYERAKQLIEEALALRVKHLGDRHLDTAESRLYLGIALNHLDDHVRAEQLVRQAVESGERIVGPNHWGLAFALTELGSSVLKQKRYDEAERIFVRAAKIYKRWPKQAMGAPTNALGLIRAERGDYEGASRYYREALAINEKRFGAAHPLVLTNRANLATALLRSGKAGEAEAQARDIVAARRRVLGNEHPDVGQGLMLLAEATRAGGQLAQAEPFFAEALAIYEKRYPAGHSAVAEGQFRLGRVLVELGRPAEAESRLRAAFASQTARLGASHASTIETQLWLGTSLLRQARVDDARRVLIAACDRVPREPKTLMTQALERLDELSRLSKSPADAAQYRARLAAARGL